MTSPAETRSPIVPQLLELLDRSDPDAAAQLRAELAGEQVTPTRPATALDTLRDEGWDNQGLTVSEIPNSHEVPLLLGVLAERVRQLTERLDALAPEDDEASESAAPAEPAPVSVPVGSADAPPAPVAPADTLPAGAPIVPAPTVPEPAPADVSPAAPSTEPAPADAPPQGEAL